ncbi:hypothetical protein K32_08590 [Kaistia sp. 32K]|uniref:alpha/beta hydrolase n=1 Tax=Kaistia sp. 32K TaxID=2795690 RepID=UPI0019153736|nr:alpha/beta hydrolase [Kaistia sp. 32K]BCP52242.1 hypothetical protein K32_08590 [Kaistia sp. 32K]
MTELRTEDFTYAVRPEGDQLLTVFSRPDIPARAVLLYFHGGGWRYGSREMAGTVPRLAPFTKNGVVVLSADYRLSDAATYPAQLQDAGDAYEWAAERYPGLPIFLAGSSAGGHLASLVGLGAWEKLTKRSHARRPAGVITYALVADPLLWDAERQSEPLPEPGSFAHSSFSRSGVWPPFQLGRHLLREADPIVSPVVFTHVGREAPPFLILHGDRDTCVSYRQSVQLFETLGRRDGKAYLLGLGGADHEDQAFAAPLTIAGIAGFIEQFS